MQITYFWSETYVFFCKAYVLSPLEDYDIYTSSYLHILIILSAPLTETITLCLAGSLPALEAWQMYSPASDASEAKFTRVPLSNCVIRWSSSTIFNRPSMIRYHVIWGVGNPVALQGSERGFATNTSLLDSFETMLGFSKKKTMRKNHIELTRVYITCDK